MTRWQTMRRGVAGTTAAGALALGLMPGWAHAGNDEFARTVSGGWGSAPGVGAYDTAGPASVRDGQGRLTPAPGATAWARARGPVRAHADISATVSTAWLSGRGMYLGPVVHLSGDGRSFQQAQLRVAPDGRTVLRLIARTGTLERALTGDLPVAPATGAGTRIRLQAVPTAAGFTLRAKAWPATQAEPAGWLLARTVTGQRGSGGVGVLAYTSRSARHPAVAGVDDLVTRGRAPAARVPAAGLAATAAPAGGGRPGAHNTGAPAGGLRDIYPAGGVLDIRAAGAVYDRVRIHGYVKVKAPNVTIRRSMIVGPSVAPRNAIALVNNYSGATGLVVEDSTLIPKRTSVYVNGVFGQHFTLRRVEIAKTVDGVMVFGATGNVRIESSWIHDLTAYAHDPAQGGRASHNDGVQVQGGRNLRIVNNTITGGRNAALMVTQDYTSTRDLWFTGNYADHGGCHVNIAKKDRGYMTGLRIDNNVFGHHPRNRDCAILFEPRHSNLGTAAGRPKGNVWADTRSAVGIKHP